MTGVGVGVALVAVAAQERGGLSLQRGLEQQSGAEPGDLLKDVSEVSGGVGEQLVDLGTDAVNGRYSCRHGRGSPF
jgi:hypothetical protein